METTHTAAHPPSAEAMLVCVEGSERKKARENIKTGKLEAASVKEGKKELDSDGKEVKMELYPDSLELFGAHKYFAVGCSSLSGNRWDGQIVFGKYSMDSNSDVGLTLKKTAVVRTSTGICDIVFAGKTATPLLLSAGDTGAIECWQTGGNSTISLIPKPVSTLVGHSDIVSSLDIPGWSEKSSHILLSASWDKSIKLWDLSQSPFPVSTWTGHHDHVTQVRWSKLIPDLFVSTGKDGLVLLWDQRVAEPCGGIRVAGEASAVDVHPTIPYRLALGTSHGALTEIDLRVSPSTHDVKTQTSKQLVTSSAGKKENKAISPKNETSMVEGVRSVHGDRVSTVVYSLDGTMIASGSEDNSIRISSSQRDSAPCHTPPEQLQKLSMKEPVSAVAWVDDKKPRILSVSWDRRLRVHVPL